MKSVPKLINRFVGIMLLSIVLLLALNVLFYAIVFLKSTPTTSAWDMAEQAAVKLQLTDIGYTMSAEMEEQLKKENIWAVLISDDTKQVVWQTENLPDNIPMQYTLSDISDLTRGYIDGYPTFTGEAENGLLILGYPKDSYWKLIRANWDYDFITNLPKNAMIALSVNVAFIFLIYIVVNFGLLRSIKPITNGIQNLSGGEPVFIKEKGALSELAANINKTSAILQKQAEQLRKKEMARANWIAGISHDIRTPLSMVMGYAGQLENAPNLTDTERKKAAVIVKQSERMRNLINDLNLASKLEYNMQPLMMKQVNAVAVVRQVVVDFINLEIEDKFSIEWKTDENLSACHINADTDLLKRAVINLIQNSMKHNENGCTIYVTVADENNRCIICVEDNGVGISDEKIESLNNTPHYMVCDTNTTEQRHGLGLLIVKQIMESHNGQVTIGRSLYNGFRCVLTIPK